MLFLRKNNQEPTVYDDFMNLFNGFDAKNGFMATDIKENETNYELIMDVPGTKKEDVGIKCENGYLTVEVSHKEETEDKEDKKYIRKERRYESQSRSFYVGEVKMEDIKAKLNDGALQILIPKETSEKTNKYIAIE